MWLGVPLSSSQVARLFDQQYLWMVSIDIFEFLHGNNQSSSEVVSETTTFGWMQVGVSLPIRLEDSLINNISGINQ